MTAARNRPRADDYRGFTLPELVFVLSFIGIAAIVFVSASLLFSPRRDPSHINIAKSQASMLDDAVNMYVIDVGICPTTVEGLNALEVAPKGATGWKGPYLQNSRIHLDPWNRPFNYQASGNQYRVWSSGPNGTNEQGRGDDIAAPL